MNDEKTLTDDCSRAWLRRPAARGSLIALALVALVATGTEAAKPGGGGGGGTGGGTVYYSSQGGAWSMNSDGSGKTLLPVGNAFDGTPPQPSRLLHGGFRWFLQRRQVAGTYPSGAGRVEIFAVRGDGNELYTRQLTDSPDHQLTLGGTWLPGDVGISEVGHEWLAGGDCSNPPYPQFNPCVIGGGIYSVGVHFAPDGNVDSLPADPGGPVVDIELYVDGGGTTRTNAMWHDWSPNSAEIVHTFEKEPPLITRGSRIVVVATGVSRVLTDNGIMPRWSPDGSKIAFHRYGGIWTIAPAGTGLTQILSYPNQYQVRSAYWSPTGSHVIYYRVKPGCPLCSPPTPDVGDVYRATATGGSLTNLTGDVLADARPLDWR